MSHHVLPLLALIFVLHPQLRAEQSITLKTGTQLVGESTIDGDEVIVEIDNRELRIPLRDVNSIAEAATSSEELAERLLISALEATVANKDNKEVLALLTEASRLAPADPRIAYWYASSLLAAGNGQAASAILQGKYEAVAKVYPNLINSLRDRINKRLEFEKMPVELVHRIDKLNAIAAEAEIENNLRQYYAVFRLVDQNQRPIKRSEFHISGRVQDEQIESFDNGYFLHIVKSFDSDAHDPCLIEICKPGIEPKTFKFTGSSNHVQNSGEFVAQRYDKAAQWPVRISIVDAGGKPIGGAKTQVSAITRSDNQIPRYSFPVNIGDDGSGEIALFPMSYSITCNAKGFLDGGGRVRVGPDGPNPEETRIQLHREIRTTVRIAWLATNVRSGDKMSGETVWNVVGNSHHAAQSEEAPLSWIHFRQLQDAMNIVFSLRPMRSPTYGAWIRSIKIDEGENSEESQRLAVEKFNSINLADVENLKGDLVQTQRGMSTYGFGSTDVNIKPFSVFVAKAPYREMVSQEELIVTAKILIEDISRDDPKAQ